MADTIRDYYRVCEIFCDDVEAVSVAINRIGTKDPKKTLERLEELKLGRYTEHIKAILSDPIPHLHNRQLTFYEYFELTTGEPL